MKYSVCLQIQERYSFNVIIEYVQAAEYPKTKFYNK